jgi:hypothetical protein
MLQTVIQLTIQLTISHCNMSLLYIDHFINNKFTVKYLIKQPFYIATICEIGIKFNFVIT